MACQSGPAGTGSLVHLPHKPLAALGLAAALLSHACVQSLSAADDSAPPPPPTAPGAMSALESLLAPIALYPDPLIALILPASTLPDQVSAASAFMIQYGDPTQIDSQPWDPSVRALAHYPTVITWMAQNMAWTQALGSAFQSSPSDVMVSIQSLRARAWASGALASTPQQQVYSADGAIEILPAQPDVLYVPVYDSGVVYSDVSYSGYGGPFINFGSPYPAGAWLTFCFDWSGHSVWVAGPDAWRGPDGWHRPPFSGGHGPQGARAWQAPANPVRTPSGARASRGGSVPQPQPMPGAPNPPPAHFRNSNPSSTPVRSGGDPSQPFERSTGSSAGRTPPAQGDENQVSRGEPPSGSASRSNDVETRREGPEAPRPAESAPPAARKEPPPSTHETTSRPAQPETSHSAAPPSAGAPDSKDHDPGR